MRVSAAIAALIVLGACAPPIPDSNPAPRGVGFDDFNSYRAQQDAELARAAPPATPAAPATEAEQLAADTATALGRAPASTPEAGVDTAAAPAGPDLNNPRISDEQNFDAVASRETIESDAERLAAQREAYRVIEPTAVPVRPADTGPNIVAYALQTTNALGQQVYRRTNLLGDAQAKAQRRCAGYASPDLAQQDFLANGGPDRDRLGIDPDGDGFACGWDPRPFRTVSR
ncbi:hypothetical protein [Anianabacter salinae]|uniref:hypothetical protein n=1 Tax=Anianabacter salinae TaxID=2851023 RepID=UPI00225E3D06|nr:hypothetical protein [Anianabacter salinae]MBV0913891.1 hypothetical protein [Anianabacter salinae]